MTLGANRVCPVCKSDKIMLWMGGFTGAMYRCPNCGYVGPVAIETTDSIPDRPADEEENEASN